MLFSNNFIRKSINYSSIYRLNKLKLLFSTNTFTTNENNIENEEDKLTSIVKIANNIGLNKNKKHIFLCADQTKPKCCNLYDGIESWNYLKKRLKELKLSTKNGIIGRTKVGCMY
jgi:hypothetical protein